MHAEGTVVPVSILALCLHHAFFQVGAKLHHLHVVSIIMHAVLLHEGNQEFGSNLYFRLRHASSGAPPPRKSSKAL